MDAEYIRDLNDKNLRLECLKLANQSREGHDPKTIIGVADKFFGYVADSKNGDDE